MALSHTFQYSGHTRENEDACRVASTWAGIGGAHLKELDQASAGHLGAVDLFLGQRIRLQQ